MAGTAPRPSSGTMNTSSASEGMVCTMPTAASTTRPRRGRRQARTPSGTATRIAASSERLDQHQVLARCAAGSTARARWSPPPAAYPSRCSRKPAATAASGWRSIFTRGVELDHRWRRRWRPPEPRSAAPGLGPARLGVAPVDQDGVVAGKVGPVVLQHAQPVVADLGVGRVEVDHVDVARPSARGRPGRGPAPAPRSCGRP